MIILLHYGRNQGKVLASAFLELAEQWNYDKNGMMGMAGDSVSDAGYGYHI